MRNGVRSAECLTRSISCLQRAALWKTGPSTFWSLHMAAARLLPKRVRIQMCSCALGKSGKFSVHVSFVKGNACSVLKERFRKPLNNISKLLMGLIFPHILCGKSSYEALKAPSNPLFLKDVFPETQPFKTYPSLCCWKIHQLTGIFFSKSFCFPVLVLVLGTRRC